jgi:hypothetical protein
MSRVEHPFARPGQVAPDRPAPDACMRCGFPAADHDGPLPAPGRDPLSGPFETERDARDLPAVRAIYDAGRASSERGDMSRETYLMLFRACEAAGVDLGGPSSYDRQILAWLANWEPQACAVVAGLITRAAVGAGLTAGRREVLGQALADAIEYRTPGADCPDCDAHPAGLCYDHAADLDRTDAYLELGRQLGIEGER